MLFSDNRVIVDCLSPAISRMPPWNAVSLRKRYDVPRGINPPRLACAIVLRHLDIAALEGIMMRLGMLKTSDNVCVCTQ